jgi:hypothetical protein
VILLYHFSLTRENTELKHLALCDFDAPVAMCRGSREKKGYRKAFAKQ